MKTIFCSSGFYGALASVIKFESITRTTIRSTFQSASRFIAASTDNNITSDHKNNFRDISDMAVDIATLDFPVHFQSFMTETSDRVKEN